jgi:two-component system response regulator FixJ
LTAISSANDLEVRPKRRFSIAELSSREREVLAGVARGLTNKEIGIELGISHRTVEIHRARLKRKLDVTTVAALLAVVFTEREQLPVSDVAQRKR